MFQDSCIGTSVGTVMAIGRTTGVASVPEWTFLTNHAHVLIFLSRSVLTRCCVKSPWLSASTGRTVLRICWRACRLRLSAA